MDRGSTGGPPPSAERQARPVRVLAVADADRGGEAGQLDAVRVGGAAAVAALTPEGLGLEVSHRLS